MERTKRNAASDVLPECRLLELSEGEFRSIKCHVVFEEGKQMADEILFLRAEVTRLSSNEPQRNEEVL